MARVCLVSRGSLMNQIAKPLSAVCGWGGSESKEYKWQIVFTCENIRCTVDLDSLANYKIIINLDYQNI